MERGLPDCDQGPRSRDEIKRRICKSIARHWPSARTLGPSGGTRRCELPGSGLLHVGNVRVGDTQTAESKTVPADEVDARSKYAARNTVQIKRISVYSVCEWPRDPDYVQAV